ncbi:MAG: class IV adenylate cyclase [Ignavibacteria bacterium]|nr:class IV adenylate cyclase [Ignavibacteria bacterium]
MNNNTNINIEIKAKCGNISGIKKILKNLNAEFKGTDLQTDTYFKVNKGRLKLREGNIENNLIYYERRDNKLPEKSEFILLPVSNSKKLKAVLTRCIGVLIEVKKKREIYFSDNVKIHLDVVKPLGSFVEIEANNQNGKFHVSYLRKQCDYYSKLFGIGKKDLISESYSDMMLKIKFKKNTY